MVQRRIMWKLQGLCLYSSEIRPSAALAVGQLLEAAGRVTQQARARHQAARRLGLVTKCCTHHPNHLLQQGTETEKLGDQCVEDSLQCRAPTVCTALHCAGWCAIKRPWPCSPGTSSRPTASPAASSGCTLGGTWADAGVRGLCKWDQRLRNRLCAGGWCDAHRTWP